LTRKELADLLLADESKLSENVVLKNECYTGYLDVDGLETVTVNKTTESYRASTCDLYTDYFCLEDESENVEEGDITVTVIECS